MYACDADLHDDSDSPVCSPIEKTGSSFCYIPQMGGIMLHVYTEQFSFWSLLVLYFLKTAYLEITGYFCSIHLSFLVINLRKYFAIKFNRITNP